MKDAQSRRGLRRLVRRHEQSPWWFFKDMPRIWPYVRPYKRLAVASVSLVGASAFIALLAPWPLAILIDSVFGDKPIPGPLGSLLEGWGEYQLLALIVCAGFAITAIGNGLIVVDNYVSAKLEQRMVLDLRSDMFAHAQRLSLAFHDRRRKGALMYQINDQASAMGAITVAMPPLAQALLTLIGMFVVTYLINSALALVALGIVPFVYYSAGFYARRIEPRLQRVMGLESQSLAIVNEAISMMRVIIAFGRERHEYRRFRTQGERAVDARIDLTVRQTGFSLGVNTITAVGTALVLGIGGLNVISGRMTPGELIVVIGYIAAIYDPLEQISGTVSSLQQRFVSLRASFRLLDTEPEVGERADARRIVRAAGAVTFDRVSFRYPSRPLALTDVSFEVDPGQRVAIVGPTGAGKSTLASLIPRFFDPATGRVILDGIDLRDLALRSLRDQISLVLQEPLLFSGTIADNIRYGRLEASMREIIEAAEAANAHDFITNFPDGYQTILGEGGTQVSGGERQRIAVARAFLKDAPILILDEPTSSIDSKTESVILDALERLVVGRTTIMIAHRLSTIRDADSIIVLNKGEIVEQGAHETLLQSEGLYRQLFDLQTTARASRRTTLEVATR